MKMPLPQLRLVAWITIAALLAMLWSGTMPARAGGITGAQALNDICSVAGTPAGAAKSLPGNSNAAPHVTHCVFCSKQDIAHALPARFDLPQPMACLTRIRPPDSVDHCAPSPWLQRHARGPPVRSA